MKAMILAAGRGERMRPLTDHTPKPLLPVHGKPLIEYQIQRLRDAGYHELVINLHHLGEQIEAHLGDGRALGVNIRYSVEHPDRLETGGGILQALPLLSDGPFLVVNGDVWSDCDLHPRPLAANTLAHLLLVPNPPHNPKGDFALDDGRLRNNGTPRHTFSGIGWYRPELFTDCRPGRFPLAPLLRDAIAAERVTGELCKTRWMDIGTPQRLAALADWLSKPQDTPRHHPDDTNADGRHP